MKPNELKEFLKENWLHNPIQAIHIVGEVGVGKSSVIKQVCQDLKFEMGDIRLSLLDATDLRGLPAIDKEEKVAYWTRPAFLPPENDTQNRVLFFDELLNCSPAIQNSALQLMLDRQIGEYKLPPATRVVCASNRLKDGAHIFRMSSALNNRFINILYEVDFNDWKEWAFQNNIHPTIIGFLNFRGELLHNYKSGVDTESFATPRSYEFLSRIMALNLNNGVQYEAIKGCIGEGAGTEFYSFMKIYKDLPNPNDILFKGKDIVPTETSQLYAICSALIGIVQNNKDKIERLIEYSMQLEKEFSVLLIKDLLKTKLKNNVVKAKNFNKWVDENKDVII